MSDEVFRVLDLPFEMDPHKITATLENGVREVTLRKVEPRKKVGAMLKLRRLDIARERTTALSRATDSACLL
jgi:hypothetical protein